MHCVANETLSLLLCGVLVLTCLSQMPGGRIQCNIQRLSVFLVWSIHLSWDYLRLQDCAAGDCNHSGIQHQES